MSSMFWPPRKLPLPKMGQNKTTIFVVPVGWRPNW